MRVIDQLIEPMRRFQRDTKTAAEGKRSSEEEEEEEVRSCSPSPQRLTPSQLRNLSRRIIAAIASDRQTPLQ